ncbi:N-acetyltransferase family protein [Stutzerimonas marianensis]
MPLTIRPATRADADLILRFITELAIYERAEHEVKTDAAGIEASLFGDDATAHALICERGGQPIGYAVYFFNYSTWLGRNGLYLEDLYVTPEARGTGAGKALLKHLARIAVSRGCGRFEWAVLDWNEPAIQFYRSLGARPQDEWTTYRVTGTALQVLAEEP